MALEGMKARSTYSEGLKDIQTNYTFAISNTSLSRLIEVYFDGHSNTNMRNMVALMYVVMISYVLDLSITPRGVYLELYFKTNPCILLDILIDHQYLAVATLKSKI